MFKEFTALAFKINEYCNLDCKYCFQQKEVKKKHNGFTDFRGLVSFLSKLPIAEDGFEVKVTGGESSLFCNEIRKAYKEFKRLERFVDTRVYLTTISNGTNIDGLLSLMDDGILDPSGCKISWDGIHSASKSRLPKNPKYNDIYFNEIIYKLGTSKYGKDVLVRIALTEDTVDDLFKSVKYAIMCGCKKIEYYYLSDCEYYTDPAFQNRYMLQMSKIIKLLILHPDVNFANFETLFFTETLSDKDKFRAISCRHLGRMLYIENDGKIAPCGYFSHDGIYSDCEFYIGDIYKGFSKDKIEAFIAMYKQPARCGRRCENYHCFECPAVTMYRQHNMCDKMMQACEMRDLERLLFKRYSKEKQPSQIEKAKRAYTYVKEWTEYNYDTPTNLPFTT